MNEELLKKIEECEKLLKDYSDKIDSLEKKQEELKDKLEKHKHSGKETADISNILEERLGISVTSVIGAAETYNLTFGGFQQVGRSNIGQIKMNTPLGKSMGLRWSGGGSTEVANITLGSVPAYANNAAAVSGGLLQGDIYRTGGNPDSLSIVT